VLCSHRCVARKALREERKGRSRPAEGRRKRGRSRQDEDTRDVLEQREWVAMHHCNENGVAGRRVSRMILHHVRTSFHENLSIS
jgi:hypothetical protein